MYKPKLCDYFLQYGQLKVQLSNFSPKITSSLVLFSEYCINWESLTSYLLRSLLETTFLDHAELCFKKKLISGCYMSVKPFECTCHTADYIFTKTQNRLVKNSPFPKDTLLSVRQRKKSQQCSLMVHQKGWKSQVKKEDDLNLQNVASIHINKRLQW